MNPYYTDCLAAVTLRSLAAPGHSPLWHPPTLSLALLCGTSHHRDLPL